MAGLLDALFYNGGTTHPLGLLGDLGRSLYGSYSGGSYGGGATPEYDQMGNPLGTPVNMRSPYPAAEDPMTAGGVPQQSLSALPLTDSERKMMALAGIQAPPVPQPASQVQAPAPQAPVTQPLQNPISIGNYQMPRIGDASAFVPQTPTDISSQSRQPEPSAPTPLPPALGGGGLSNLGRAFNPDGLIARLTGNDSRSVAQQNLKAQYDALVPIVGPQKAMLAVLNPEAGKTIITEALTNKQQFKEIGVAGDGSKQYGFVNERDQSVRPYSAPGSNEPVTMQGPDGKPIQMPAGADAATWRKEITRINADVAAGKKTEVQAKAEIFGNKMELANKSITDDVGTSLAGKIASGIPLGNYVQTPEYQRYKQAASNFITALLRQESGAAISKTEFDRYEREYMPQPGDSKEVLAQKAETRRVAIDGMKKGAGPGYKSPASSSLPSGWSVTVR